MAVPGEVGQIGAESGLGREGERAAVKVGEFEVRPAREDGFGDVGMGNADAEVVIDGPEPGVEEVMGRRSQCRSFSSPSGHLLMAETSNRKSNTLDRSCHGA